MIRPDRDRVTGWVHGAVGIGYERVLRPALFRSHGGDPEAIHEQLIGNLGRLPAPVRSLLKTLLATPATPVTVCGIEFGNRVGLAAGLDKDARAALAWSALGFGFAEVGTVTPRPQPGNDRPRLFRLPASKAVINRMGFNNHGAAAMARRLQTAGIWRGNGRAGLPLGISIGKNKATALDRSTDDYLAALEMLAPHADYLAINVSSPNTPGLRSLQNADELTALVSAVNGRAVELAARSGAEPLPIWVKLAPDLTESALDELVDICQSAGASALIATNTTLDRSGVAAADLPMAEQAGGLSGAPLKAKALRVVERVASRAEVPVIGVGGIMSGLDALALFNAGADLVQLYTGFIYRGPTLVGEAVVAGQADRPIPRNRLGLASQGVAADKEDQ